MSWHQARKLIGALFLIDGALALAFPSKYLRALQAGSPMIDDILDYLADNPALVRRMAAAELATGLLLILG